MLALSVFVILLFQLLTAADRLPYNIYVGHAGIYNSSCWEPNNSPCASLNLALKGVQKWRMGVMVSILPGNYTLNPGYETNLSSLYAIEIAGTTANPTDVIIKCAPQVGLAFHYLINLVIRNITIMNCGAIQISTSRDFHADHFKLLHYQVALYMSICNNVTLSNVHIDSSNGTGLTMYNVFGHVYIIDSVFSNNPLWIDEQHTTMHGGSGLQIEFTYCLPIARSLVKDSCAINDNATRVSKTLYTVSNTNFINNAAHHGNFTTYKTNSFGYNNFVFGKGGGFSIIFKGNSTNNSFYFHNVTLQGNRAKFGGGFYVALLDFSSSNTILISDSHILENTNKEFKTEKWDTDGAGGGGKMMFETGREFYLNHNNIIIQNSVFSKNIGIAGGGLSTEVSLNSKSQFNEVFIKNLTFTQNYANLGSAAYFSQSFQSSCQRTCLSVHINGAKFNDNMPVCEKRQAQLFTSLPCSGTLYSSNIPLNLTCASSPNVPITFTNNVGSALELHASHVEVQSESSIEFSNNTSKYGGAIALYDCSCIFFNDHTTFTFFNNTATEYGGAIYSDTCTSNNQPTTLSSSCFLQYYDSTKHPNDWNSTFHFINNILKPDDQNTINTSQSSSIYAMNAIPCWWPKENHPWSVDDNVLNTTFCWKTFSYRPSTCDDNVKSAPAYLEVKEKHSLLPYMVQPGDQFLLPVEVWDGTGDKVQDIDLRVCIVEPGIASFSQSKRKQCKTVNNKKVVLYNCRENISRVYYNKSVELTVETLGPASLQVRLTVSFKECKWPFYLSYDSSQIGQCSLDEKLFCCSSSIKCDACDSTCGLSELVQKTNYVKEKNGQCISYDSSSSKEVTGQCPYFYYNYTCSSDFDSNSFAKCARHRTGALCGTCIDNYGIPLNSLYLECVDCLNDDLMGWLKFILLEIVPITIMVTLILIFNMKISNGSINGYIFYCQVITINIPGWYYPAWISSLWFHQSSQANLNYEELYQFSGTTLPFSVWNLNFLTAIPVPPAQFSVTCHANALIAITFWYVVAVYPLLLLVLLYVWLKLYDEGYRCFVFITRPIHQRLARFWRMFDIEPALTDSIAVVYVICFTQFVSTSFKLLHFTTLYQSKGMKRYRTSFFYNGAMTYFGWPHAIPGMFAIIVLSTLVLLPTTWLLLYQFQYTQRLLNYFNMSREGVSVLYDVFTGSFRSGFNKTKDFRYFAGCYFFLRVIIMIIFFFPYSDFLILPYLQISLTVIAAGILMIARPYTDNIHNLTNFLLFLLLALISALTILPPFKRTLTTIIVVMYIPLPFVLGYFFHWLWKKIGSAIKHKRNWNKNTQFNDNAQEEHNQLLSTGSQSLNLADRVLNPDKYDEVHRRVVQSGSCSVMNSVTASAGSNSVPLQITSSTTYGSINNTTTED